VCIFCSTLPKQGLELFPFFILIRILYKGTLIGTKPFLSLQQETLAFSLGRASTLIHLSSDSITYVAYIWLAGSQALVSLMLQRELPSEPFSLVDEEVIF
jgi:hypothetical protein